jgi:hypothetical protein
VTAIKLAGKLSDQDSDYTTPAILTEAWNVLMSAFVKPVVESRQAYWLKPHDTVLTVGLERYRIPYRAVVSALEKVELLDTSNNARRLINISLRDVPDYANQSGVPTRYYVQDDVLVLLPTPNSAAYTLRQTYYLRPSVLVAEQSSTGVGKITAVNAVARTVTTAAIPTDQVTTGPIGNATLVDIVHPNGSYSLPLVNAAQTVAGAGPYVWTIAGTQDMRDIAVGDYLRAAEQTDWPCLPLEFHTTLAEAKGDAQKASTLAPKVQNDVDRFLALACPRIKESPPILKARYGVIRQSGGRRIGQAGPA